MGRHFKVKIDQDSLKYFLEQRLSSEGKKSGYLKCWVTILKFYKKRVNKI